MSINQPSKGSSLYRLDQRCQQKNGAYDIIASGKCSTRYIYWEVLLIERNKRQKPKTENQTQGIHVFILALNYISFAYIWWLVYRRSVLQQIGRMSGCICYLTRSHVVDEIVVTNFDLIIDSIRFTYISLASRINGFCKRQN